HGILPARDYLAAASSQLGTIRYWVLPTLCWFGSGNFALHLLCVGGVVCGVLVITGVLRAPALVGAWIGYLSLVTVGQDFLRFQWDSLLLEAGFVAILLAPWQLRARFSAEHFRPSRAVLWLGRWLLFRLMFSSAVVKLASGDPSWHALTALDYHYFTQPLPPWTAWYFHLLPQWFQELSVLFMFAVEGLAPFLIFGPRRIRFGAAGAIASLQVLIMITGNYGFFNLLTLALCVLLLDDGFLDGIWRRIPRRLPAPLEGRATSAAAARSAGGSRWFRRILAGAVFLMSLVPMARTLQLPTAWLGPIEDACRLSSPLQLVNPYGLFAVMTTDRPEIILEGSSDGEHWKPYEFRYKPGKLSRRPPFVIAHMPRLDWQMWFAALGNYRQNRWFLAFCQRLLEGSPDVAALLAEDPFAQGPPKYLRARVFQYQFTTPAQRRQNHAWWTRTLRGPYIPTLALKDGRLEALPQR
ncbi:MAG TPA: lipase maturation factor family protein, partial [Candidatus Krumholzibacteria bacterium]|nr:lipase maturation factor family protein [Candidatus Krumholzibacteria bacterium]